MNDLGCCIIMYTDSNKHGIKNEKRQAFTRLPFRMWSRGESNPCPNNVTIGLLHAYCLIICRRIAGKTQTNYSLS